MSLQTLEHAGIARFADSNAAKYKEVEDLYLVTEYVPGPTFSEMVRPDVTLSPEMAVPTALHLLDAIEYSHTRGILHRDIKPDNIVMRDGRHGQPVLLDFGLSFNREPYPEGFESDSEQHLGNRFIQLPEYTTRGSDRRNEISDITQVVGILFFLVTGRHPDALRDEKNLSPHEREAPKAILASLPVIQAKQLSRIFRVGFETDSSARWQSVTAIRQEILRVDGSLPAREPFETRLQRHWDEFSARKEHQQLARWSEAEELMNRISNVVADRVRGTLKDHYLISTSGSGQVAKHTVHFTLQYRHHPARVVANVEFALIQHEIACSYTVGPERQTPPTLTQDAGRIGLFDPDLHDAIAAKLEDGMMLAIENMPLPSGH